MVTSPRASDERFFLGLAADKFFLSLPIPFLSAGS